ncbi:hypothetical protein SELMODRAFT_427842 [Selaginella moellendorffii]|uniref:Uncharacterized protein n=1 Tax=Selaginella moellendorffii TaxID=88036 RepID=D8T0V9_SELML|nr:hypothetical protein SELMODRAFT_427842 [Selaginella moellendorffii]
MSQRSIVPLHGSENFVHEALLEGVEMPHDRDEIHIEQPEEQYVENPVENSLTPSHLTAVAHSPDPTATACPAPTIRNVRRQLHEDDLQELSSSASHKQVHPLSPIGSVGNVEIVIGDYFQLSNNAAYSQTSRSKQKEQVAESKRF